MKTDLEVEVQVDLRQFGKVLIFRDKQNLPIIYRFIIIYYHLFLRAGRLTTSQVGEYQPFVC